MMDIERHVCGSAIKWHPVACLRSRRDYGIPKAYERGPAVLSFKHLKPDIDSDSKLGPMN